MRIGSNLKRRGAVYYARQKVPVDLVAAVGAGELIKTLNTADPRVAGTRKLPVLMEWQRRFEDLRRRRDMTEADFAGATWQHYSSELTIDGEDRARPMEPDATARMPNAREHHLKALRNHLGRGETVLIEWAADAYIAKERLLVEPGTAQYRDLCFRLMRAQIEALQRGDERDQGDYAGKPADPLVVRPDATAEVAKPGETIMELFAVYERENPKRVSEHTLRQARRDIGTFIELVGTDFPVSKLDKKAVREWKTLLQSYPVKATEIGAYRNMGFREVIAANNSAAKPRPVIVHGTVNRYLAGFGAFCNWLASHDYIPINPFTDMYLSIDKTKTSTLTFTPEQLKTLFASPLFTGCKSALKWHIPGELKIRDHRYWLPYVMMYSGARPGEIAQLLIDDVRQMHGQWIMHFTEDGDDTKSVKTAGSTRIVPVHSELVKLGFIEFYEGMKAAGERRLFPEAERGTNGQIAGEFERRFSKHLIKLGMKVGRGLSLYSFRHGFADAMRRADYMDEEFGFLLGHGKASMTGRYGQLPEGLLAKRVKMIEAVSYL